MSDESRVPGEENTAATPERGHFKKHENQKYTTIAFYVIFTCAILFILQRISIHLPEIASAVGTFFHYIGVILKPLLAGFVIAYLLFPIVRWFQKILNKVPLLRGHSKTHNRALAIAITGILTAVVIILLLSVVISSAAHELTAVSWDALTDLIRSVSRSLQNTYNQLTDWLNKMNFDSETLSSFANSLSKALGGIASAIGSRLTSSLSNIPSFFTNAIFAIIFAIYFLSDYRGLGRYWDRVLRALTPEKFYEGFHVFLNDADLVFSGYIRGQLIDAIIVASMMGAALTFENVKFGMIIGVLTGIGNLVPYVGPVVAYVCVVAVGLLEGDLKKLIISLVTVFILQTIDGNIINPKLLSTNIDIHPMLVIAALIFGSAVGGFLGMLLSVPCAALIKIWFDRGVNSLMKKRALPETPEKEKRNNL